MKYLFIFLTIFIASCTSKEFEPASSAFEAVRNYKIACLQGDFEKAKFYLTEKNKTDFYFTEIEKNFKQLSDAQKRESYAASVTIYTTTKINANQSVIILKDTYTKKMDTLTAVLENTKWQVQLN